jgi:hypothetical protein
MQHSEQTTPTRPQRLADAAIRVIARGGLRALTHRAVDKEAVLPQGSTSYYASTRAALLEMIAARLAERSLADLYALFARMRDTEPAETRDERVAQLADMFGGFVEALLDRPEDARARYSLVMDFLGSDPLRGVLSSRSPVLAGAFAEAPQLLNKFGVAARPEYVVDISQLADALTFSRTVHAATPHLQLDVRAVFDAFLRSLPQTAG